MNSMPQFKIERNVKMVDGMITEDYYIISKNLSGTYYYEKIRINTDEMFELQKQIRELKI